MILIMKKPLMQYSINDFYKMNYNLIIYDHTTYLLKNI